MSLDRNAKDMHRLLRNQQRVRAGRGTGDIKFSAPLTNGGTLGLALTSAGGLQVSGGTLGIKLATNPALSLSASGLTATVSGASLAIDATGLKVNLATNGGLQITSGLGLLLADSSLQLAVGGVSSQLAANGGLELNTGLQVKGHKSVASDPASPADGDQWYNSTAKAQRNRVAGLTQGSSSMLDGMIANSGALVNTTTQTALFTSVPLPPNWWTARKAIRVQYHGQYSCNLNSTISIGLYAVYGATSVSLDGTSVFTAANPAGNANFGATLTCMCRTTGAAGAFSLQGDYLFDNTAHTFAPAFQQTTADTTQQWTLQIKLQWSAASAGNTVVLTDALVEVLDPSH